MSTSRPDARLAALTAGLVAAALVLGGCSPESSQRPVDVAEERLGAFVSEGTQVAGFSISPAALTVYAGRPVAQQVLFRADAPDASETPVEFPAQPLTVPGRDFPLTSSVTRARALVEECPGEASVSVWALAPDLVTTQSSCETDAGVAHSSLLDDRELPVVADPISGAALADLWAEAAGLGVDIVRVEVDAEADAFSVFFLGSDPARLYQWSRGLSDVTSTVLSHPSEAASSDDLSSLDAAQVGAALDELLTGIDPAQVARVEVSSVDGGVRMVLSASDWTELASTDLGS